MRKQWGERKENNKERKKKKKKETMSQADGKTGYKNPIFFFFLFLPGSCPCCVRARRHTFSPHNIEYKEKGRKYFCIYIYKYK